MNTYSIIGQATYTDADTDSGFCTIDIDTTVNAETWGTALDTFLDVTPDIYFNGQLISSNDDRDSGEYHDEQEGNTLDIQLLH